MYQHQLVNGTWIASTTCRDVFTRIPGQSIWFMFLACGKWAIPWCSLPFFSALLSQLREYTITEEITHSLLTNTATMVFEILHHLAKLQVINSKLFFGELQCLAQRLRNLALPACQILTDETAREKAIVVIFTYLNFSSIRGLIFYRPNPWPLGIYLLLY